MFDVGALWRQVMALLAALPDDDRDEIVASLVAGTVTDGEVAVALAGFLAGRDPRPDPTDPGLSEVLLGTLDDQETDRCTSHADVLRVDPGPGVAAALAELAATAGPGGELPAGLSDEQVLAFIQAAEQQARWAHALRGTGLRELATRWTARNPAHDTDTDHTDAGRQRRLRKIERREERTNPVRRAASSPRTPTPAEATAALDEARDRGLLPLTFLGEAFTVAEAALATGVTETTAREWLTTASRIASPTGPAASAPKSNNASCPAP